MRIKSGVWHWLAAGCGLTGLLVGMGIEGGAQLGGVITDGEVCTAIGLLVAAVVFMRLGFAAQDREKQTKKIHQQPGNTVQRSRRKDPAGDEQPTRPVPELCGGCAHRGHCPGKGRGDGKAALCGVRQLYAVPYGKAEMRKECRHGKQH